MPDFLPLKEAAKHTGYNQDYLGQLVRAGKVEAMRVGKAWLVNRQSLVAYLSSIGKKPTDQDLLAPSEKAVAAKAIPLKIIVSFVGLSVAVVLFVASLTGAFGNGLRLANANLLRSLLAAVHLTADFNKYINYQGKMRSATTSLAVPDANYSMTFSLYNVPTGGSNLWTETRSVATRNGLFSVLLGTSTPFTNVNFNQPLYLGVKVGADAEMTPRKMIGAVPAAFSAETLTGHYADEFIYNNATGTISTSSTYSLLTLNQTGSGNLFEVQKSGVAKFVVLNNGTASTSALSIDGALAWGTHEGLALFSAGTGSTISTSSLNINLADTAGVLAINRGGTNNTSFTAGRLIYFDGTSLVSTSTTDFESRLTFNSPLSRLGNTVSIPVANGSSDGYLTSGDWASFSNKVSSQWVTNGSNIYYSTGNVGIGTSSPTAKLQVAGDVSVGSSRHSTDKLYFGLDNYQYVNYSTTSDGVFVSGYRGVQLASNGTAALTVRDGNVGIGTVTPTSKLSVVGDSLLTGNLFVTNKIGVNETNPLNNLTFSPGSVISVEMDAPTNLSLMASTTGGTLTTGTYYYVMTAVDPLGNETTRSAQSSIAVTGPTGAVRVGTNNPKKGASYYKLYRTTTSGTYGASSLAAFGTSTTLWDYGASYSGTPPTTNNAMVARIGADGLNWLNGDLKVSPNAGLLPLASRISNTNSGNYSEIISSGNYIYAVDTSNTLQTFDVSYPQQPVKTASNGVYGISSITGMTISGDLLFLSQPASSSVAIFSLKNPAIPTFLATTSPVCGGATRNMGSSVSRAAVYGRRLFVPYQSSSLIQEFDISNPSAPVCKAEYPLGMKPTDLVISGRYMYITELYGTDPGKARIFDVSTSSISLVGNADGYTKTGAFNSQVKGSYWFISSSYDSSLQVFDVSNPASPVLLRRWGANPASYSGTTSLMINGPRKVNVSGNYAYVCNGSTYGLTTYDITDPRNFYAIAQTKNSTSEEVCINSTVNKNYIYTIYQGNINIYKIATVDTPALVAGDAAIGNLNVTGLSSFMNSIQTLGGLYTGADSLINGTLSVLGTGVSTFMGQLGVGTSSPNSMLSVTGNSYLDGTLTVSNTATFNSVGASTTPANLFNSPVNTVSAMFGTGNTSALGANEYGGAIRFNGAGVAWGDMSYYPNGGDPGEYGHFRLTTTATAVNTTPNAKLGVGSLYSAGNVGIGTTSPVALLSVLGTTPGTAGANATDALYMKAGSGADQVSSGAGGAGGGYLLYAGNGGSGTIGAAGGQGGGFTLSSGAGGGGSASAGSGGDFSFTTGAGGAAADYPGRGGNVNFALGVGGSSQGGSAVGGSFDVTAGNGGSSIYGSGVGGGITLKAGSGGTHQSDSKAASGGLIILTAGAGGSAGNGTGGDGANVVINGGAGGSGFVTGGSHGNVILADLRGNVGIGTSTPVRKLDVYGDMNVSLDAYLKKDLYLPGISSSAGFAYLCWDNATGKVSYNDTACTGAASPFFQVWKGDKLVEEIEFAANLNSQDKAGWQTFTLQNWDLASATIKIENRKAEVDYIDQVSVVLYGYYEGDQSGMLQYYELKPSIDKLEKRDGVRLVLAEGDKMDMSFSSIPKDFIVQSASLKTYGFYIPNPAEIYINKFDLSAREVTVTDGYENYHYSYVYRADRTKTGQIVFGVNKDLICRNLDDVDCQVAVAVEAKRQLVNKLKMVLAGWGVIAKQDPSQIIPDEVITSVDNGSTTTVGIATSTDWIVGSIYDYFANKLAAGVRMVKELSAERMAAVVGLFDKVKTGWLEADTVQINKGMEIKDALSGETYCVRIAGGEWQKEKGACANASASGATPNNSMPTNVSPLQVEPSAIIDNTSTTTITGSDPVSSPGSTTEILPPPDQTAPPLPVEPVPTDTVAPETDPVQ